MNDETQPQQPAEPEFLGMAKDGDDEFAVYRVPF